MLCFRGGTHKVLNGEAPCRSPTPHPFHIPFLAEKEPLSYTFHWEMVPLSHTSIHNSAFLLTAVNTLFFFKYQ